MPSPNQRTGRAWIYIDGNLYETHKGAKLSNFMGVVRNAVEGADVYGYTEETRAPTIDGELVHGGTLSLSALQNITNSTVTFRCDSGVRYVLEGAWLAEMGDLDSGKGSQPVKFMGRSCEEIAG